MEIASTINIDDIQRDIANDLVKGIIKRLHEIFGSTYTFYAENVPQGFKTPSFAVLSMNPLKHKGMGIRKFWEFPFDVLYFCDSKKPRQEWNTIEQKLALELELLDACNTKLHAKIQPSDFDSNQNVGHFYVVYGMHLMDVYQELDKMEYIENEKGEHIAGKCNKDYCPLDWR